MAQRFKYAQIGVNHLDEDRGSVTLNSRILHDYVSPTLGNLRYANGQVPLKCGSKDSNMYKTDRNCLDEDRRGRILHEYYVSLKLQIPEAGTLLPFYIAKTIRSLQRLIHYQL